MFNYTAETFTPSDAQDVLAHHNQGNRNLAQAKVAQYEQAMRESRWKLTPVPLIFEEGTGRLLDGQNRLTAVVKSGKTQTFMVCRNATADLMSAIDQGKSRTASDHMKIEGIDQSTQLSPLCLAIYSYNSTPNGNWAVVKPVANEIYVEVFNQDPDGIRHALGYGKICNKQFKLISKTDFAFAYYLLRKAGFDELLLIDFFNSLTTGAELSTGSAVLAFRNFLANDPKRYSGDRNRRQHTLNNIFKCFEMYYNQTPCSIFRAAPLIPTQIPCV